MSTLSRILLAFIMFLITNFINAQQINETNALYVLNWNKLSPKAQVDTGFWSLKKEGILYCITISNSNNKALEYSITNCYLESEVNITTNKTFEIDRATGTLKFVKGKDTEDSGTFSFAKDEDYILYLEKENIKLDNDLYYFKLFLADIETPFITQLKNLGFKPTLTELGKLIWHDVSIDFIIEKRKKGIKSNDIWDYINEKEYKYKK
ncbi:hypothetical protein [Lacinutrix chionoecetis]